MMLKPEQAAARLRQIRAWASGLQEEATRLIEDIEKLEPISASAPRKGKSDPLPEDEVNRLLAKRLKNIIIKQA